MTNFDSKRNIVSQTVVHMQDPRHPERGAYTSISFYEGTGNVPGQLNNLLKELNRGLQITKIEIIQDAQLTSARELSQLIPKDKNLSRIDLLAETRAAHWLAEANSARDKGNKSREEKCLAKSQYWLDKANKSRGWS